MKCNNVQHICVLSPHSVSFKCVNSRLKSVDPLKWYLVWVQLFKASSSSRFIQIWLHLNEQLNKCHMWLPKMSATKKVPLIHAWDVLCMYIVHTLSTLQEAIRFEQHWIEEKCLHSNSYGKSLLLLKDQGMYTFFSTFMPV